MAKEFFTKEKYEDLKACLTITEIEDLLGYFKSACICFEMAMKAYKDEERFMDINLHEIKEQAVKDGLNISEIEKYENNIVAFMFALSSEYSLKAIAKLTNFEDVGRGVMNTIEFNSLKDPSIGKTNAELTYGETNISNYAKGHNLASLLYSTKNGIIDLIKWQTILAPCKKDFLSEKLPGLEENIQAADLLCLLKDFNIEDSTKKFNSGLIEQQTAGVDQRYPTSDNKDIEYLISLARSSHIVLCYLINKNIDNYNNKKVFKNKKILEKIIINNLTEDEINKLKEMINDLNVNDYKEFIVDYILLEKQDFINKYDGKTYGKLNDFKYLKDINNHNYYELNIILNSFSDEEIEGIIKEYEKFNNKENRTLFDFFNYFIFIKAYAKNIDNLFTNDRIPNIRKLFDIIIKTNDISKFGNMFIMWFKSINVKELTLEEFNILNDLDSEFIYGSLDIISKIIYKKCKNNNLNFYINSNYKFELNTLNSEEFQKLAKLSNEKVIPMNWLMLFQNKEFGDLLNYENLEQLFVIENYNQFIKNNEELKKILEEFLNDYQEDRINIKKSYDKTNFLLKETDEKIKFYNTLLDSIKKQSEKFIMKPLEYKPFVTEMKNIKENIQEIKQAKKQFLIELANLKKSEEKNMNIFKLELIKLVYLVNLRKNVSNFDEFIMFVNNYKKIELKELDNLIEEKIVEELELKEIKNLIEVEKIQELGFEIFEYYKLKIEYGNDLTEKILEISKKTNIPLSAFNKIKNIERVLNLIEDIELIDVKEDMLVLDYSQLFENISLVGSVDDYIFYKTPEQIEEIQKLCQDKNIDFKNEFLYFDMGDLKNYINELNVILDLKKTNGKIQVDDINNFINEIKEGVNSLHNYAAIKNKIFNEALIDQTVKSQEDGSNHKNVKFKWKLNKKNNSNKIQV